MEDDIGEVVGNGTVTHFNPRPPCGGRLFLFLHSFFIFGFQSTSPVWRTTVYLPDIVGSGYDFNPRPPCGGRLVRNIHLTKLRGISIHVPRVEDDLTKCKKTLRTNSFQSTSPVWRTTNSELDMVSSDSDFNPRPPCGGRLRTA